MTVRLSLLNKVPSLAYSGSCPVALVAGGYEIIGTCEVYTDQSGRYLGRLDLNREVSEELFFYYRNRANNSGQFWFSGLDLMETQIAGEPTTQLKEMIVSSQK